ncbi:MAG TPA: hypothetical protein VKJ00_14630, partial [Thermoanaerobaculia bacterium]|nr:hypothetical protein [Thermoanaerobaculia bacterium]
MERRAFMGVLTGGLLAAPLVAEAQQAGKVYRVGILTVESADRLRPSLRELGYIEGQNAVIEVRDAAGKPDRLEGHALELVRLKVDRRDLPRRCLQCQAGDDNDSDRHGEH